MTLNGAYGCPGGGKGVICAVLVGVMGIVLVYGLCEGLMLLALCEELRLLMRRVKAFEKFGFCERGYYKIPVAE